MKQRGTANKLLILSTACQLAKRDGWSAVSVRKIADKIQYTAPIVYEFFESRDDLIAQVVEDGFASLRSQIALVWKNQDNANLSLVPVCLGYWRFAVRNPEIYDAMNLFVGLKKVHRGVSAQTELLCTEVSEMIETWAQRQSVKKIDSVQTTEILWGHLHGLVTLGLSGQLGENKKVETLISQSVRWLEIGLKD